MRLANKYHANKINDLTKTSHQNKNGVWVPSRPEGFLGLCLFTRLKQSWLVFMGKVDILEWEE